MCKGDILCKCIFYHSCANLHANIYFMYMYKHCGQYLAGTYQLYTHYDVDCTNFPGDELRKAIKSWPRHVGRSPSATMSCPPAKRRWLRPIKKWNHGGFYEKSGLCAGWFVLHYGRLEITESHTKKWSQEAYCVRRRLSFSSISYTLLRSVYVFIAYAHSYWIFRWDWRQYLEPWSTYCTIILSYAPVSRLKALKIDFDCIGNLIDAVAY